MMNHKTKLEDTSLLVYQCEWEVTKDDKPVLDVAYYVVGVDGVDYEASSFNQLKRDQKQYLSSPDYEWQNPNNQELTPQKLIEWHGEDFFRDLLKDFYNDIDYVDGYVLHAEPVYDDGYCDNYDFLPEQTTDTE